MKKSYIIPSTESVACQAGSVCASSGAGRNVTSDLPGLGIGGELVGGNPD